MITRRSVFALSLLAVASCRQPTKRETTANKVKVIGVATLMSHPALDQVRQGLTEGLRLSGLEEGRDFRFIDRNASGQTQLTASIAAELAAQAPDLIIPITTPMAQAVKARWHGPIVFGAVTDPVGGGLVADLSGTHNITGTSDAWPYRAQLQLIRRIQPGARKLAVLFNPGEAASQYGIREIRRYAPEFKFEIVEYAVSSTNEVAGAAALAARSADAIFLSSDNTVIAAVSAALAAAVSAKKALYVGDSGTVEKGGLAAVSVGYTELGVVTGRLAARVLRGEDRLPIVVASGSDVYVNTKAAELMGVTLPKDVIADAKQVFTQIRQ